MDEERLKILLERFQEGDCTPEEKDEVLQWYRQLDEGGHDALKEDDSEAEGYVDRMYEIFISKYGNPQAGGKKRKNGKLVGLWGKAAAILLLLIAIGTVVTYYIKDRNTHVQLPVVVNHAERPGDLETASRYVRLPDGSVVILQAGSTLKMLDSSFSGKTREVALSGEAYFDVHHMDDKPFIVHIGKVKVRVLGTAFNIRDDGDSLSVTVTRGKVSVSNSEKVLAVLTPNQQMVYHQNLQVAGNRQVKAAEVVKWIKQGLTFNDEGLAQIAAQLQARYGAHFSFTSEAVKKCRVTVNVPFSGTESLDEILAVVCPIVNATYKIQADSVQVDGPGCNE